MPAVRNSATRAAATRSFESFVASHSDNLLRTAYLVVWDLGEAEDLVQECLLRVARRWSRVGSMAFPAAYARRILVNLALDTSRRRTRRRSELSGPSVVGPTDREDPSARQPFVDVEARTVLLSVVGDLPPRQRAVLVLRYFEDLTEAQTAELLGCSIGTVKSTASHALDRMRQSSTLISVTPRIPVHHTRRRKPMIDQLEADLRDAFRSKASSIPAEVSGRIRSTTYRPRTTRWSPRVTYGAVAGAALTTAAVVSAVVLGNASPAFAGWSATPTAPTGNQLAQAEASCQAQVASRPGGPPTTGGDPVLTDVRGPYSVAIYATATSSTTCFTGPSFTSVSGSEGAGALPASGKIQFSSSHMTIRGGSPYTLVDGRTGADVTGVSFLLDNGQRVQATLAGGWFEAWWPGSANATSADIATPSGTTTQSLNPPPVACTPSPQAPCAGSSTGSGTSTGSGSGGSVHSSSDGSAPSGPMSSYGVTGGAGTASTGSQP